MDLPQLPTTIPKYLHPQLSSSNRDFFTIEFACLQNKTTICEQITSSLGSNWPGLSKVRRVSPKMGNKQQFNNMHLPE